jgi:hypothetical protein
MSELRQKNSADSFLSDEPDPELLAGVYNH